MPAGDRVHSLGVLRFVVGEAFDRKVVAEIHKGIEDREGRTFWTQMESHELTWAEMQDSLGPTDFKAVVRVLKKLGSLAGEKSPALGGSELKPYDDERPEAGTGEPSML
ncbi:MAG: hypothetical protein IT452_24305 [Planctomycetia bacterium]|nr:hypothetical protein [Planctomycetia bacterium]